MTLTCSPPKIRPTSLIARENMSSVERSARDRDWHHRMTALYHEPVLTREIAEDWIKLAKELLRNVRFDLCDTIFEHFIKTCPKESQAFKGFWQVLQIRVRDILRGRHNYNNDDCRLMHFLASGFLINGLLEPVDILFEITQGNMPAAILNRLYPVPPPLENKLKRHGWDNRRIELALKPRQPRKSAEVHIAAAPKKAAKRWRYRNGLPAPTSKKRF